MSRRVRILLTVVVLLIAAPIAGTFAYINFIKKDAPKPLGFDAFDSAVSSDAAATGTSDTSPPEAVPTDATTSDTGPADVATSDAPATQTTSETTADSASTSDLDGTWTVGAPSTAGYRVKEILFGQATEGVGRTSDVTGTVTIADNAITEGTIDVDLTTLKSDADRRDGQVQGPLLETAQFPKATFTVKGPIALPKAPEDGATAPIEVAGTLDLHGVQKDITISLQVKRSGASFQAVGSTDVVFSDYSIKDPSNPAVKVDPNGLLELAITFAKG